MAQQLRGAISDLPRSCANALRCGLRMRTSDASGRQHYPSVRMRCCVRGATLVEFVVVIPTLLMMIMAVLQAAFAFHAKSQVNHATAAAARAGSFDHAALNSMTAAFTRGMVGYYGGGTSLWQLTQAQARAASDLAGNVRIEVLSPTPKASTTTRVPPCSSNCKPATHA